MPKVVKTMRVEPALWARVEAFAEKNSLKVNGAAERLLEIGLLPPPIPPVKRADPDDGHYGSGRANAKLTGKLVRTEARDGMKARWSLADAGVAFGPKAYIAPAAKGAKK
jgi:hypothetical protein